MSVPSFPSRKFNRVFLEGQLAKFEDLVSTETGRLQARIFAAALSSCVGG